MIVLDLLRKRLPSIPVLFLETGYHFAQTYEYRDRIAREWKLNLVNVAPQRTVKQQESELGILYVAESDEMLPTAQGRAIDASPGTV